MRWPPGNASAPLAKGRREKLNGLPEPKAKNAFAQPCKHRIVLVEWLPKEHAHYGRETCERCKRFVRWLPKPGSIRVLRSYLPSLSLKPAARRCVSCGVPVSNRNLGGHYRKSALAGRLWCVRHADGGD